VREHRFFRVLVRVVAGCGRLSRGSGACYREAVALRRRERVPVLRRRDDERRRLGTFAPFCRASLRPIAIACLRLRTRPPAPRRPRLSVPFFRRRIAL
jgi:hypothetical protein